MSLLQNPEPKPGGGLAETDRMVLDAIKAKKEMAISKKDLKFETKLPEPTMKKCLKNLQTLGLIKKVPHVQQNGKQYYIAAEFEPSDEITGGSWYVDGNLYIGYIDQLKTLFEKIIRKRKVATADGVYDFFKDNIRLIDSDCTIQQISEILRSMVLDNVIIDVISTGVGEYRSIPVGKLCYRCLPRDLGHGRDG